MTKQLCKHNIHILSYCRQCDTEAKAKAKGVKPLNRIESTLGKVPRKIQCLFCQRWVQKGSRCNNKKMPTMNDLARSFNLQLDNITVENLSKIEITDQQRRQLIIKMAKEKEDIVKEEDIVKFTELTFLQRLLLIQANIERTLINIVEWTQSLLS